MPAAWRSRWSAPGYTRWPRQDAIAAAIETLRATPTEVEEARLVAFGRAAYDEIAAAL